ncbi:MAG: recombinase family protein [Oscillospiraceae bacterium]|nr:recombinase family protein [Oscillospiraceae bacterium]
MDTYGYIRVSTKEQNEDRQVIAIWKFGVADSCIVLDKQSGKDFKRPAYCQIQGYMLKFLCQNRQEQSTPTASININKPDRVIFKRRNPCEKTNAFPAAVPVHGADPAARRRHAGVGCGRDPV